MRYNQLIEYIAKQIYSTEDGMTEGQYIKTVGIARPAWKKSHPAQLELPESEREGYRFQARCVVDFLLNKGLIQLTE